MVKFADLLRLPAVCLAATGTLDNDVEMCSATTSTIGPDDFEYSLTNLYRTADLVETPTDLKLLSGEIPEWLEASWYRTGPGKFEFGNDSYLSLGDPMAMFQLTRIENGKAQYLSAFQRSIHHQNNEKANAIVAPELGTWGEPEFESPDERVEWMQSPDFVSDNAYVSFFSIDGRLFASGETYHIWEVDPITLKGLRRINLHEVFERTVFRNQETTCATLNTHLAHTRYDFETDELFLSFNCGTSHLVPKITYVMYKIPNAGYGLTATPTSSIDDIWNRAEIICEVVGEHNNPARDDYKQDYFHDFVITENYVIFELISMQIDYLKMPELMVNGEPLAAGAGFDDTLKGTFYIADRRTKKVLKRFRSLPNMALHVLNAFEEDTKVIYDTTEAPNGNQFGTVFFANLTGDHHDLKKIYEHVAPVQEPMRYTLDLEDDDDTVYIPKKLAGDGFLPAGGADFPVINKKRVAKRDYQFAWFNGFREVFNVDSVYKLNVETGESICRKRTGYVPSEGVFIPNPNGESEDDGILMHQWLPLLKTNRPKLVILDASNLKILAELEYPVDFLPVGIHGMVYDNVKSDTELEAEDSGSTETHITFAFLVLILFFNQ